MSEQRNTTTPRRTRRQGQRMSKEERITAQEEFLKAFANTANVRAACMKAGIDRSQIYRWAEHDEQFSLKFKQASLDADDMIRAELFRRAVQGVDEPIVSVGKLVYVDGKPLTVKKYSDSLLSLLARARMPEFREKQQDININNVNMNMQRNDIYANMRDEELDQLERLWNNAQERLQQLG